MTDLVGALVSGVLAAVPIFLVASGLTVVYGTLNVLNFAHGAIFMLGAYLTVDLLEGRSVGIATFLGVVALAAVVCGVVGAAIEVIAFRRLYRRDHLLGLLASFALLFVIQGLAQRVWGAAPLTQQPPQGLNTAIEIGGVVVSRYAVATALMSGLVGLVLWQLLARSSLGKRLTAVADDRDMAEALGIRANRLGMAAFILSGVLAGIAGALLAPQGAIEVGLSERYLILAFAIIIVGGIGSLRGAFLGAIGVGVLISIMSNYATEYVGFAVYIGLAAGLLLRRRALVTEVAR